MKKMLLIVVVLLLAAPLFAQGPFNDVPTDHWAYDAVNKLQKDGIVIGYPDGTFGGKRAMSRYEFATAIARILPLMNPDLSAYATKAELQQAIAGIKVPEAADLSQYATKADLDALKKLIDEFRDTLAQLGVDVDALKRDVAALAARVDALEAEQKRVRWSGDLNVFAISTATEQGVPFDLDERETNGASINTIDNPSPSQKDTLIRNITVVRDFDLNLVGRVNATTTANATINYGNYLQYLGFIDNYVDGIRPYSKSGSQDGFEDFQEVDTADMFFPYYMYINTGLCKGSLTVGRMPLQLTPYTLKKIDVDSYTTILKTDDGNYPVDGIKAAYNFGGVDVTLFAVRNDLNSLLQNGLTGQPTAGLFSDNNDGFVFQTTPDLVGNHVVGNLAQEVTQTAGGRLTVGTPWKGTFGATYYQAWSEPAWAGVEPTTETPFDPTFDQARVFGGDLTIPFGQFGFTGSWTRSDTLASSRNIAGLDDVTNDNTAWDAALTGSFGKLGAIAGYKRIERNFAAAGAWDKIGRWTNPTDVQGPYLDLSYPIARKLKLALNGEFLTMIDDIRAGGNSGWGAADDQIIKAEAGVQWGISKSNSLDLGYQWVRFSPDSSAVDESTEAYLTVGWAHQLSPNAGFKVGYQFINYNDGALQTDAISGLPIPASNGPYVGDYRGGVGVVQFGVSF